MPEPAPGVLVELDDRRRVSLGRVGRHGRYLAREEKDGTIVMTPAVVMTVAALERILPGAELELTVGTETARRIAEAATDPTKRVRRDRPLNSTKKDILAVIRDAGPGGIRAKDIWPQIDVSRSTVFNELAAMRTMELIQNLTGAYVLGPKAPAA